jgi:hypothetical protein
LSASVFKASPGHGGHRVFLNVFYLLGETINAYKILIGKPEERRPLERPRRRWKLNVKMDIK